MPGYKKGVIDFDDVQVRAEYERNGLDPDAYRNIEYSKSIDEYFYETQFDENINVTVDDSNPIRRDEIVEADKAISKAQRSYKGIPLEGTAYSYNHVFWYRIYGRRKGDYDIIRMASADSVEANIHEVEKYAREEYEAVIDEVIKVNESEQSVYRGACDILENARRTDGTDSVSNREQGSKRSGNKAYGNEYNVSFSKSVDTEGHTLSKVDTDYLEAVDSGDMKKAMDMVEEAAIANGFTPTVRYHQTGAKFTRFNNDNQVAGLYDCI